MTETGNEPTAVDVELVSVEDLESMEIIATTKLRFLLARKSGWQIFLYFITLMMATKWKSIINVVV